MTFPDSCLQCDYADMDEYTELTGEDFLAVFCNLNDFWVDLDVQEDPMLPYWCPLKEMWRR